MTTEKKRWLVNLKPDLRNKDSVSRFLLTAIIQGILISGIIGGLLGFFFDQRLEDYKNVLEIERDRLTLALGYNDPAIQQRYDAYTEIQGKVRNIYSSLIILYGVDLDNPTNNAARELNNLKQELGLGSGSGSSTFSLPGDLISPLEEIISLKRDYTYILSDNINSELDLFLDVTVTDYVAFERGENTESYKIKAISRLNEAYGRLENSINQALRVDELPIE